MLDTHNLREAISLSAVRLAGSLIDGPLIVYNDWKVIVSLFSLILLIMFLNLSLNGESIKTGSSLFPTGTPEMLSVLKTSFSNSGTASPPTHKNNSAELSIKYNPYLSKRDAVALIGSGNFYFSIGIKQTNFIRHIV